MKGAVAVMLMLAVAASYGCMSPQGGGLGKDNGFKFSQPMFSVKMKQGETRTFKVELKRGKFFKEDVRVEARPSEGINVQPKEIVVKASDPGQVMFQVSAPANAPIGEYRIYIRGVPETGETTSLQVSVSVTAP